MDPKLDADIAIRLRNLHDAFHRSIGVNDHAARRLLVQWQVLAMEVSSHVSARRLSISTLVLAKGVAHNIAVAAEGLNKLRQIIESDVEGLIADLQRVTVRDHTELRDSAPRGHKRDAVDASGSKPSKRLCSQELTASTLRAWFAANLPSPFVTPAAQEHIASLFGLSAKKMITDLSNWRRRSGWTHMREAYANGSRDGMKQLIERIMDFQEGRSSEGWEIDSKDLLALGIWSRVPESERREFTGTRRRIIDLGGRLKLGYSKEEEDGMFKCFDQIKERCKPSKMARASEDTTKSIFPFLETAALPLPAPTPLSTSPSSSPRHHRSSKRSLSTSSSCSSLAAASSIGRMSRSVSTTSTTCLAEIESAAEQQVIELINTKAAQSVVSKATDEKRGLRWSYTTPESFVFGNAEHDATAFFPQLPLHDLGVACWDQVPSEKGVKV